MGIKLLGKCAPEVNWTSMRSLLEIGNINEFPSRKNGFLLDFILEDLGIDIFIYIPPGIGYDVNIGKWVLNCHKYIYRLKEDSANWF